MMINFLLGIFYVYLSSQTEDLRKGNKRLWMFSSENEGLILIVECNDCNLKADKSLELDKLSFHLFEYKNDKKENFRKSSDLLSSSNENFIKKVQKNSRK